MQKIDLKKIATGLRITVPSWQLEEHGYSTTAYFGEINGVLFCSEEPFKESKKMTMDNRVNTIICLPKVLSKDCGLSIGETVSIYEDNRDLFFIVTAKENEALRLLTSDR